MNYSESVVTGAASTTSQRGGVVPAVLCHLHQRCRRSTVPVSTVISHLNSLVRDVATFWCYRPPFPAVAVGSWWSCCSGVPVVCGVAVQSPCELATGGS